jgi:predicted ATPase/DNA-binding XRE family transcriptional regulator
MIGVPQGHKKGYIWWKGTLAEVSFGDWLKRQRKAAGWTQDQLALQISCSTSALKKIEAEERRPSAQIVERLAEIFDIPPNEQASFLRFARGDWRSAPKERMEDAPWRAATASPRANLPSSLTSLIGREQDIAKIGEYLSNPRVRLATLIGPPGIGKTSLSLQVGREVFSDFANGVFFVALAPIEDPSLVPLTMVQTLGFVETPNRSPLERLKDGIGDKQMLILLDNIEHLIEATATLVSEILSDCPRLKILTTSREALRVPGEWLYFVSALNVPTEMASLDAEAGSQFSALTLFAERAQAVSPDFSLNTENIQTVAMICTQLDGLPLAIELIAARVRLLSLQELLTKLSDQFVLSADGIRAASERQKTLHGAIAWSYELLSNEEQEMFVRLSVFSGGFTAEAAESIFSRTVTDKTISNLIASLLDKSLLQRTWNERGEPRFDMLVTIQQFAVNHLHQRKEETYVRNWHLSYFLDLAEKADKEIHGPNQIEWMDWLETEHDNFRTALIGLKQSTTELTLRLFGALSWFRRVRGHMNEARTGFDKIRAQPGIGNYPAAYARVLNAIGRVAWLQGDYRYAQLLLNESREVWQKLGVDGERGLAEALDFLGMVARSSEQDSEKAQSFFEQSIKLYRKCGDPWGLAEGFFHLGINEVTQHENTLALSCFEQSLALFKQLGDLWAIGRVSSQLGNLSMILGDFEKAHLILQQGLNNDRRLKFKQAMMDDLVILAALSRRRGDYDQAAIYSKESLTLGRESGLKRDMADALYSLGVVALHRNDYSAARQYFTDFLDLTVAMQDRAHVGQLLTGLATVVARISQYERAATLYGAAQGIIETIDYRIPTFDQAEFDRHIQIAREQLGEARFETFATEGRALTLEQAIAYALEDSK